MHTICNAFTGDVYSNKSRVGSNAKKDELVLVVLCLICLPLLDEANDALYIQVMYSFLH